MISEKTYWIFLVVVFAGSTLLTGLWLIPHRIVEYNLGVNIFTGSIFMVLTIVFLSWLSNLREKHEWRAVKDLAYSEIRIEASSLFDNMLTYIEKGHTIKYSMLQAKEERRKEGLTLLRELRDPEKIKIEESSLHELLADETSIQKFREIARRLSNVQVKYSKFLSSELTVSLMEIQYAIRSLEINSKHYLMVTTMDRGLRQILAEPNGIDFSKSIADICMLVRNSFKALIDEINNVHDMGIELRHPY